MWVPQTNASTFDLFESTSVSWLQQIGPGQDVKYGIQASLTSSNGVNTTSSARSDLTLVYAPFFGVG